MELHESLQDLGRSQGPGVFDDADSFRGALDDYLDEGSASTGDINLLVDAVRLGAFEQMKTMLDSGADADRAVAEAGARLARDRGSADVGGAMWAVAVLGYAVGKVSEDQVRRYRTRHTSAQPPVQSPPTMLPGGPSPTPPVTSPSAPGFPPPSATTPVWPSSGGTPAATGPVPPPPGRPGGPPVGSPAGGPAPYPSGGAPGGPAGPYSQAGTYSFGGPPPPKKKSALPLILVAVVAVLVLVGGGIAAVVLLGGDDNDGKEAGDDTGSETTSESVEEGLDVSFDAVNSRYSSLSQMITTGASECAEGETSSGETEKVECTFSDGTLTLTTYASEQEVKAARDRTLSYEEGTITADVDSGAYYSFSPTVADENSTEPARLYWDSAAGKQSALYVGNEGVTVDTLESAFDSTVPTVEAPDGPVDLDLKDFAQRFSITKCERIHTEVDGETEESRCRRNGYSVWIGKFDGGGDFRSYRQIGQRLKEGDGDLVDDYWYIDADSSGQQDGGEKEEGKIYGYVEEGDPNRAVLYIDDLDCLCYLQMYDKGTGSADPVELYNLIFG